ncbi:hypothetical protein [Nostoc sp.]
MGKIVEAMSTTGYAYAEEFLAKYLSERFESLADIPGHSEIVK